MAFCRSWRRRCAYLVSARAQWLPVCEEFERFLSLIQRSSIRDALTVLLHEKGVDDKRGGAKQPCVHRGRGLASDKFIHERRVNAAAKLAEALGQYKVGLRRIVMCQHF